MDYSEKVMEHFTNPQNVGKIENADGVGEVGNARCGDIMKIYLKVNDEGIIEENQTAVLVTPIDQEAPKGRMILPQVQMIRALLDKNCKVIVIKEDKIKETLSELKTSPSIVITDSQAFRQVEAVCPQESKLTSFSVLFAGVKGDLGFFAESARKLLKLEGKARILIAEACTHQPLHEDIGRVKIPRLLRKKLGEEVEIVVASGKDFPENLEGFDLIIHCGGCMFNRTYMLSRVKQAKEQGVPMTNYGVAIASLLGILDRVAFPR